MKKETILITGGAGYIGTELAHRISKTYNVVIIDDLSTGTEKYLPPNIFFYQEDIRNTKSISTILKKHSCSTVIHLAGLKSVTQSLKNPDEYRDVNVNGTQSILSAMSQAGSKRIIFSSTAAVYKPKENGVYIETDTVEPISIYGKTKHEAEKLIINSGVNYLIFRFFNIAGTGSTLYKEGSPENVFPILAQSLYKKTTFPIYGSDHPTPDGTCIRDYIHLQDLINAHVLTLKKNKLTGIINLGTERGTSVKTLIQTFEDVSKKTLSTSLENKRDGELAVSLASNKRAQELLGWKPKKTLIQMVTDTIKIYGKT